MIFTKSRTALTLFLLCAGLAAAGEQGVSFSHKDWEVVCDNTRTCRMAGYSTEEDIFHGGGSVLITRAAGPNTPLEGKVTLADYDEDEKYKPPRVLTLWIGGKSKGKLKLREKDLAYPLTQAQTRALLAAARSDGVVEFKGEPKSFTLSGQGVSAAMLKMDEVQGRIGTPGALIRKGKKSEESVLPSLPVPVIRAARVRDTPSRALTRPEVAALKPLLLQSKRPDNECFYFDTSELEDTDELTLSPLDKRHVLISTPCWSGAYNAGDAYWVMDSALKGIPKFVTRMAYSCANGMLHGDFKGRGPGDCWHGARWVWNGREFRQSAKWDTGMCRGIHAGGTWHLPRFVTKIINEDGTPREDF
jgi:hypothetical protein